MRPWTRTVPAIVVTFALVGRVGGGSAAEPGSCGPAVTGAAGAPEFTDSFTPLRLSPRDKYDDERGPALARVPDDLSIEARFGVIRCEGGAWTIAVDGTAPLYSVIVDVNANGDLTDDPRRTLAAEGSETDAFKIYSTVLEGPGRPMKITGVGSGPMAGTVASHPATERRGSIEVGGRSVPFVLEGSCGKYDHPFDSVSFDLDGNGAVDTDRLSDERFTVPDRYVAIDGVGYEFEVAPSGDWLRLTPSTEAVAPRPSLALGAPAPDFAFTDLAGQSHRLSDYRGQVVLLHAWGTWCAPCRWEMPHIIELYSRFHDRSFEILGLAKEAMVDDVRAYVAENKISWPQSVQGLDGPVLETYRIQGIPTVVLIDREGRIAGKELSSEALVSAVAALADDPRECQP